MDVNHQFPRQINLKTLPSTIRVFVGAKDPFDSTNFDRCPVWV